MLKIAICDDEKVFINEFKDILEEYLNKKGILYEINVFYSGEELTDPVMDIHKFDIIFLDIGMKSMDGMSTAKKIRESNKSIYIVFVTVFADFMADGYKVDAVRYILKNKDNLKEAVYECVDAIQEKMHYMVVKKEYAFQEGVKNISLDRLLYVESKLHKLEFYLLEDGMKKYTLYKTLNALEDELSAYRFLRIHQSYLVNMKYIRELVRYKVILYNDISLDIPKARYKEVEKRYVEYRGEF